MAWTEAHERALAEIVEQSDPQMSWGDIAYELNGSLLSSLGQVTRYDGDACRKKALRMGLERPESQGPDPVVLTDTDDFIGLRTVYADIEATDLGASWGHLLCCSFCDEWGNTWTLRLDDPQYAGDNLADDRKLAVAIRDELEKFDVVVGHNFRLYDKPFINARVMLATTPEGLPERPIRDDLKIFDTLFAAGGQNLRLGSRRLDNIAKYFSLSEQKTPLTGQTWQLAAAGVKEAMDDVVEHCEHDVRVERLAFGRLKPFVKIIHR